MTDAPMIVRVKPLVWEEAYDSHPWGWKARCAIMGGFYYADNDAEKQQQDSLRASRILAALDMTPDPRVRELEAQVTKGELFRLRMAEEYADALETMRKRIDEARAEGWRKGIEAAAAVNNFQAQEILDNAAPASAVNALRWAEKCIRALPMPAFGEPPA